AAGPPGRVRPERHVLGAGAAYTHTAAYRLHEYPPHLPPAADPARELPLPRGQRHAGMADGQGLGVRRQHRSRGLERQRRNARHPDARRVEPADHGDGAAAADADDGREATLRMSGAAGSVLEQAKAALQTGNPAAARSLFEAAAAGGADVTAAWLGVALSSRMLGDLVATVA